MDERHTLLAIFFLMLTIFPFINTTLHSGLGMDKNALASFTFTFPFYPEIFVSSGTEKDTNTGAIL